MFRPPGDCPVCGEFVPKNSYACPHCSADERSGWKEDDTYDGLDLPDEDFNYDDFIQNEFSEDDRPRTMHPVWWITGIILLFLSIIGLIFYSTHP